MGLPVAGGCLSHLIHEGLLLVATIQPQKCRPKRWIRPTSALALHEVSCQVLVLADPELQLGTANTQPTRCPINTCGSFLPSPSGSRAGFSWLVVSQLSAPPCHQHAENLVLHDEHQAWISRLSTQAWVYSTLTCNLTPHPHGSCKVRVMFTIAIKRALSINA